MFTLPSLFGVMPWIGFFGGLAYTAVRGYLDFFTDAYLRDVIESDDRW